MKLDSDGFYVRRSWGLGMRRIALDDVERIEGGELRLRGGDRLAVAARIAQRLEQLLVPVSVGGQLADVGARFAEHFAGPFVAPFAAQQLLDAAEALGASDIHVEPGSSFCEIRFRLAGELSPLCALSVEAGLRLCAALKGLSQCLAYRRDIAQEGRIPRPGVAGDVRASFVPTAFGERVALRLFGRLLELDRLGLSASALAGFRELLACSTGLVVVAGSTGAGKTTTLYAALAYLARTRGGAHLSLEQPIEQRLRAAAIPVDQLELAPERGFTGEAALVAALRQDVDVLCVGEVRTPEEAKLAIGAAHTGRLVLAGLHAGSCSEARQRLLDLGVDEALLDSTLRGVLWQTLQTRRCGCADPARCGRCRGLGRERQCVAELERPHAPRMAAELACVG